MNLTPGQISQLLAMGERVATAGERVATALENISRSLQQIHLDWDSDEEQDDQPTEC